MKLIEILKEMDCWDGYKPGNPKTKISSKTGKRVNNCVPIKEEQSEKSPAYMYSPVGFGCHVCKFYYVENKKHMCNNSYYTEYKGTNELIDDEGNQIKDPSKWCSNWFMPKEK